jgi:sphinganine-1-phosphate aldolase
MVLNMFNAPESGCGTTTAGGTESILLAMLAYREMARKERGVRRPNLVVPASAHAAFNKACFYFGIELRSIPVDPETFCAVPSAMELAIDSNTIAIVGSAVGFPQGVLDPIEELAALAQRRSVPMHVDSCLGSFVIALAEEAGHVLPPADFRVPGVTSISCDTHKYGFGPKGCSVIMYRSGDIRRHQYFSALDWMGGMYASPTLAGSRPGTGIAGTWAVMVHLGRDGYVRIVRSIIEATQRIGDAVRDIEGIELYGEPATSVVCFGAARSGAVRTNPLHVADAMSARGWTLNALQSPPCAHIAVTAANVDSTDTFIRDLREAVAEAQEHPERFAKGGHTSIYGSKATAPKAAVGQLVNGYLDTLFKA